MAQDAWTEKFNFTLKLDGRRNVAIDVVAQLSRELKGVSLSANNMNSSTY